MVLQPFEQPNIQARFPRLLPGMMASIPANHHANRRHANIIDRPITRIDPFPMADRLAVGVTTNEEIFSGHMDGIERLSSNKITFKMTCLERKHQWCELVQELKHGPKTKQANPNGSRPFGKFSKRNAGKETKTLTAPQIFSRPRVRFQDGTYSKNLEAAGVSMDTSTASRSSTITNSSGKKSVGSLSTDGNHSNHRCARLKVKVVNKSNYERLYWSRSEVKQIRSETQQSAEYFRAKYPATVKQVSRLFEEFCSNNNKAEKEEEEDDDDNEEILRGFLQDWASSDVRGLEEEVTARKMFMETRKMGIESVLAYQESLREQQKQAIGRVSRTNALATRPYDAADRMAELIRARSESTSHRSRMFAMYMALGDALVIAANDEFSYDCVVNT